jgi:GxxExxY protein
MNGSDLLYRDECYRIQGAVFEVYREMGCGFLEAVYQECLEREFDRNSIPFQTQQVVTIAYKGNQLLQTFKPDFICFGKIMIEIKSVKELVPLHRAQIMNYLKATRFRLGLLVNFGNYPRAKIERIIL